MYLANNVLAKRFYGGLGFTKGTASSGALDRIHTLDIMLSRMCCSWVRGGIIPVSAMNGHMLPN